MSPIGPIGPIRLLALFVVLALFIPVSAQITIGGNVYGGGNAGNMTGNTKVTVYAGDLNQVYGGARQADVGGAAFVHIDGEHASDYILINKVFGGNDISGTVGRTEDASQKYLIKYIAVPNGTKLTSGKIYYTSSAGAGKFTSDGTETADGSNYYEASSVLSCTQENGIDDTWDAAVRISTKTVTTGEGENAVVTEASDAKKIYIGQLFGGGNGDYDYTNDYAGKVAPALNKAYLEILGGSIVNMFGGGNCANVTESTVIHLDNPSEVVNHIYVKDGKEVAAGTTGAVDLLNEDRFKLMGFNYKFTYPNSGAFQIGNLFGGNNKVDMAIQPRWNLLGGKVRNLYSGGNEGRMTCPQGLLLVIPENSTLKVDNVYGGCRKADVRPLDANGKDMTNALIQLENNPTGIPAGFSARTRILGGNINNVYGGNDISGNVYGGNTVAILTTIHGNVYGGGNGSYAYTDNTALKDELLWKDFYYDPDQVLTAEEKAAVTYGKLLSATALNKVRPNAEQVSLLLRGTKEKPVFIEGAVFVGGNSASLSEITKTSELNEGIRKVEVKIGSYVTVDKMFLGNNGENMVKTNKEERDDDGLKTPAGVLRTIADTEIAGSKFNSMDLKDPEVFDKYMEGCAMKVIPRVVFDDIETYDPYTANFGSFYCGGNVGSMLTNGLTEISFNQEAIVYNKLVGGCNSADVSEQKDPENGTIFNAAYQGGLLGEPDDNGDKLKLNLSGLKIQPKRWKDKNDITKGLVWNTISAATREEVDPVTEITYDIQKDDEGNPVLDGEGNPVKETFQSSGTDDLDRRLTGGNIYGGCDASGHINGNVIINIDATLMDPDVLFDKVMEDEEGEAVLYGDNVLEQDKINYHITERRTGVILGQQGMDVLGTALNVFGGGKGKATEIWGSTTINLNKGYTFQIFGGSEEGVIGKYKVDSDGKALTIEAIDGTYTSGIYAFNKKQYEYNSKYSCTINMKGGYAGVTKTNDENHPDMADCEFIYGGGFMGPICGNTIINLGNGRLFNSFAGSCNADILGHTETYVGRNGVNAQGNDIAGFPYVRDYVYGGNDLGGRILGTADFSSRIRHEVEGLTLPGENAAKAVSAYTEYAQGHALGIFGGCYGTYDYTNTEYKDFFYTATFGKDNNGNETVTYSEGATADNLGKAKSGYTKPRMDNAFVNFRPTLTDALKSTENNKVTYIYGSGQGYPGDSDRDIMQNSSYILIDIPQEMPNYSAMEVFGAGAWSGLGMREYVDPVATPNTTQKAALDKMSAIIDLPRGQINAVYGGSYEEGFTRRTVVSVPEKSTIKLNKLFGGAYGLDNNTVCDVYETNVTWSSPDGRVGSIFGGNNNARRTLYGRVNINSKVWTDTEQGWMASVYGAGFGENCWSQYTEVNFNKGAQVYMLYGGGQNGRVCNVATVKRMFEEDYNDPTKSLKIADPYTVKVDENTTHTYTYTDNGLNNPLAKPRHDGKKYNTNVIINKGSIVGSYVAGYTPGFYVTGGYAYGGGMGSANKNRSGDVNGTTYIALLGGTVEKDIVAAGSVGSVFDRYGDLTDDFGKPFEASTTAYIAAGVVRNVFGGGYMGSVGKHKTEATVKDKDGNNVVVQVDADLNASTKDDIPAQANVIVGIRKDQTDTNLKAALKYLKDENPNNGYSTDTEGNYTYGFYNGEPAIQRNVYGGGEGEDGKGGRGGAVFGTANVVMNSGRIGYDYIGGEFIEKLNDETWTQSDSIGRLKDYGNIFGGGYSDKSNVDQTNIKIWGGLMRGSVHGGGEIAAVGRGSTKESGVANSVREFEGIYKAGKTHIEMYNGHVLRNIFGGGKGYNVLGFGGANDLYTDGYVFGQTEVYIYGGEVGTAESVREGKNDGNVFGGGDLGYVYGRGYTNAKTIDDKAANIETGSPEHYYYYYNDYKCKTAYDTYKVDDVIEASVYDMMTSAEKANWENKSDPALTEDCKVVVSPYLQVKNPNGMTINGHTHPQYDYVETDDLNTLPKDKSYWSSLFTGDKLTEDDTKERGVIIHNAVFGGGNVSSNSDTHYANATTVFANTTATLYDCYHRDFITVGTEHTGGLYGGGNLSKSNGYRELNITNYGTDYYGLQSRITIDEYRNLSNRERAYFQLEYVCKDNSDTNIVNGKTVYGVWIGEGEDRKFYEYDQRVKEEDYEKLKGKTGFTAANWQQYGFCSIYAGRLLNTIQRADLCGVYGSRMVLQGAKDRVAEVGEDVDYTINRVGELSLNKQRSMISADEGTNEAEHGNYFGIYSVVNYLGNLTSDVKFGEEYKDSDGKTVTDTKTGKPYTYYSYKTARPTGNDRNYGTSPNQVALASGVFLELTTEQTEKNPNKEKEYGYVTGVIELDLINVKRSTEGGGFVYAKNEHRVPLFYPNKKNVILSEYNEQKTVNGKELRDEARTYKQYRYFEDQAGDWSSTGSYIISGDTQEQLYKPQLIETSGNFIHPSDKRIVDDCYPTNNAYIIGQDPYSKAHYWYVKGSVYVYKQVVSAYTGSASAYSKNVRLPLTITAASNGRLKLLNVKPNLYAYYFEEGKKIGTNGNDGKAWVNYNADMYQLNDVITWWDWNNLPASDKKLFVPETYVNTKACKIDGVKYAIGEYVMLPSDIESFTGVITDVDGNAFEDENGNDLKPAALINDLFRSSNNIGKESGYVLTFDMDTPKVWDDYYTKESVVSDKIMKDDYTALSDDDKKNYVEGPTFHPIKEGVYGQRDYNEGDIVTKAVYDKTEEGYGKDKMKEAYVATETVSYTYNGTNKTVNTGTAIPETEYSALTADKQASFGQAKVCINTLKLAEENYIVNGELLTEDGIKKLKDDFASIKNNEGTITGYTELAAEIDASFTDAYICTETGKYGGQKYLASNNYNAMESWCSLSKVDRNEFTFNYDALDLFADPNYSVEKDGGMTTEQAYHAPYSDLVPVEYTAVYNSDVTQTLQFTDGTTKSFTKGNADATLTNAQFENIRNDKRYYTRIETSTSTTEAYIAKESFTDQGTPYGEGQVVDAEVYGAHPSKVEKITGLTPNSTTYYCYKKHQEGMKEDGTTANMVEVGTKITEDDYKIKLVDHQQYFVIRGQEPIETTTLYVNRESDIRDLTKEKVITAVYQYTYYENGDNGDIKLTNELHVVNIHLQLESGAPIVGTLNDPPVVLPGSAVGLDRPEVKPGVYEVLINGWELYADENDAKNHRNGTEFINNKTPVYWYQNMDHYIAFYSKTYLGKTYSNYVPVRVANYHDIGDVMERYKNNHLYIDRADVDRPCKIYINDYSSLTGDDPRIGKNGLDELKNLFDLSLLNRTSVLDGSSVEIDRDNLIANDGRLKGHSLLGSHIKGAENLEFILRTDLDGSVAEGSPARTSIAPTDGNQCFGGNIHGDGHTISGLTQSLFGKLCGNVYNLGVTGSFTSAGIADEGDGFMENCWVKSSATSGFNGTTKAVFGNPNRTKANDSDPDPIQVVNCYYPEAPVVSGVPVATYYANGPARKMPDNAFFDGTVAYNLNGFYLGKRFYDGTNLATGQPYSYLPTKADGTLTADETGTLNVATTAYYPETRAYYTPEGTKLSPKLGYVEHRFYDGDFRYADGTIPEGYNMRRQISDQQDANGNDIVTWAPIWPDDYLYFGQTLTYGYVEGRTHQAHPSAINKGSERLLTGDASNRVYRAPAYFRSNEMKLAHFNPSAVFAQTMRGDDTKIAQKDMTAIDFTGSNGDLAFGYKEGLQTSAPYNHIVGGVFYPPLLDDGGLTSFQSVNLTKNLLAYTEARSTAPATTLTAAQRTANVVGTKLHDYAYKEGDATGTGYVAGKKDYRTVAEWDRVSNYGNMLGHWVQKTDNGYVSTLDHFLVDKHDFNAPIAYTFADDKRMWYQRTPDNFITAAWTDDATPVRTTKGWEGISLPFEAELVTTNVKGEITHFYQGSTAGHEYWLREMKEGGTLSDNQTVFKANFQYPASETTDEKKIVTNSFLWDYYYEAMTGHNQKDANQDLYQEYYKMKDVDENGIDDYVNEFAKYPLLRAAKPYIIGFPGATYYEFDLSGSFSPANTAGWSKIEKDLSKQVITFASKPGAEISVSDDETKDGVTPTGSSYTFKPSYMNQTLESVTVSNTTSQKSYALNSDGNAYTAVTRADDAPAGTGNVSVAAFRPYFTAAAGTKPSRYTRSIVFSNEQSQMYGENLNDDDATEPGTLSARAYRHKIVVRSAMKTEVTVRIVNTAGQALTTFTLQPGEAKETQIINAGVYIVQSADGKFTKKLAVR